ncbi:uncharacterized protein V6R79_022861 [Siganus canaliculatus]
MFFAGRSQSNVTFGLGLLERVTHSTVISLPCYVFLFINGVLLFALRSKAVFRETSRYVLLYNLLFADTVQIALSQLLYTLTVCRISLTYPVCGVIIMLTSLTMEISPLTLVLMSLERYVAVCFPLRHAAIITIRNTAAAIAVIWAVSSLNVLIRVFLLLDFSFSELESLQMNTFCGTSIMFLGSKSDVYDKVYTYFLFISAAVTVASSYVGVTVAARSASTDKASALKARNTLLLHLVQLSLSLLSTTHNSVMMIISQTFGPSVRAHTQIFVYVFFLILPRCLSSLIYGIRDQTIRPVLVYYLCCRLALTSKSRHKPAVRSMD